MTFSLVPCDPDGRPVTPVGQLPDELVQNCKATADLYRRIGYQEPWVGYVAADGDQGVGGGAFVGAPQDDCVEIAYFTLKEWEGRGYATRTVAALMAIAQRTEPHITIKAFTLPEHNASNRILRRHGFQLFGDAEDADAGPVWEWRT